MRHHAFVDSRIQSRCGLCFPTILRVESMDGQIVSEIFQDPSRHRKHRSRVALPGAEVKNHIRSSLETQRCKAKTLSKRQILRIGKRFKDRAQLARYVFQRVDIVFNSCDYHARASVARAPAPHWLEILRPASGISSLLSRTTHARRSTISAASGATQFCTISAPTTAGRAGAATPRPGPPTPEPACARENRRPGRAGRCRTPRRPAGTRPQPIAGLGAAPPRRG